jgi:hypothetical protein
MPGSRSTLRWLVPLFVVAVSASALFWLVYARDVFALSMPALGGPLERYVRFDPELVSDAASSLAGTTVALLGIVITVVSIIVQLSAGRYAGVTRMFLRDRVNLAILAYYVIVCVYAVWASVAIGSDFVPMLTLLSLMFGTSAGLSLMAPYFGYVFWFLEPRNIIARIRRDAEGVAAAGTRQSDRAAAERAQAEVLAAVEELTDIISSSISNKDKIIASHAVDALRDFTVTYAGQKPKATAAWFAIGAGIAKNPDLVAMDPESLEDLARRRTWLEWKVMRQYLGIYNEALASMRDINYLIAIDTRYIGEAALAAADLDLVELVFRYMNSYLRSTLNARDVRTAYNVLNQYRLLVEAMIRGGSREQALAGVTHLSYYGHVSFDGKLPFVTETIAYDLSTLCQVAHEAGSPDEGVMLNKLLELDRPLRASSQESALLGIRKAQVKLGAYYLAAGETEKARRIADDMANEPKARLKSVRDALENVVSKEFWEISDRGRNFEFMSAPQRKTLPTFFDWLGLSP